MLQLLVAIIGAISLLFSCGDRVSLLSGQGNNISAESEIQESLAEQETENAKSGDKTAGLEYNDYIGTEKGVPLTMEESEKILLSDISDEDWEIFEDSNEKLSQIVAEYSNENGYISSAETETAINAVAQQVEELYKDGIVTYYSCGSDSVTFEYACGITAYYEPDLEGYSSGSGSTDIIAIDPFATGTANDSMKNQAWQSGNSIYYALANEMNDGVSMVSYKDEEVTVSQLKNLQECTFFLWNGHGGIVPKGEKEYPVLITRQKSGLLQDRFYLTADTVVRKIEGDGCFWAITSHFVEEYFQIEDGLVYLSACHSGQNDTLADAFMKVGAEVVFVNAGEGAINTIYTQYMMELIVGYMCGSYDDIFHTANEALEWADTDFAEAFSDGDTVTVEIDEEEVICTTAEEYIEKVNGGSHTELRGVGGYTLCSCIRGEITFADDVTQDEINEILEGLTVRLETEDGQLVGDVSANADATFYFNNLDSDTTYTATLYQNEKQICQPVSVKTIEHRYRSLSIPYAQLVALEGYVYNQEGNPLADVTVNADMTVDPALWNTSALTDENGHYSLKVYGENTYTLSYTKEGYTGQETNFKVTSELFEKAQESTPCKLEDVELSAELYALYADIVREYEATYGTFGLWLGDWEASIIGVNYLRLVDMNGDGVEELLIGHDYHNYFIEVWTYKDNKADYVGSIECQWPLWDLVVDRVYTTTINGTFTVFGANVDGYTAWTYDGESLNAVATYTDEEFDNLAPSITYINYLAGGNWTEEKAKFMETWDTVLETKETLSCITDAEKALVAYQFTLLYDDTTGWFAVDDSYNLKFEYIYVDDDDIPELIVAPHAILPSNAYLYTYSDGKVKLLGQFGYYGSLEYSEKNGIVLDGLTRQGFMEYDYYQLQNSAVSLIHHFSCSYDEKTLLYGTGEWIRSDCKIDNVSVSESVYNAALSEITDNFTFTSAGWSTGQYVCRVMGDGC